MPWGGVAGQNTEHPHTLAIFSSFFFVCFKCILVLLARRNSGELRCRATALVNELPVHETPLLMQPQD